jgi:hypothetical protein
MRASDATGRTMEPFGVLDHDKLLTLAFKAQAAAHDGDSDRLEAGARKLFAALSEHVAAERASLRRVPPDDARLLMRGQQRIVDLVVDLTAGATEDRGHCRCDRVADDLVAELTLQADEERRHLPAAAD